MWRCWRFRNGKGAKLLAALSQGMYWLLVMRADLDVTPGDITAVKGRTIGAAPLVELTFKHLLAENAIDVARDQVRIVDVNRAYEGGVSFGVAAAKALEDRQSTASGPMPWVRRMPSTAASARSCSMCAAASGRRQRFTTPFLRW